MKPKIGKREEEKGIIPSWEPVVAEAPQSIILRSWGTWELGEMGVNSSQGEHLGKKPLEPEEQFEGKARMKTH